MFAQWVKEAIAHKKISGAELARQMTQKLGRSIDRAAVQKMMMTEATAKTKPRRINADELIAIAEITGYPAPDFPTEPVYRVPLISWVSAGHLTSVDSVAGTADAAILTFTDLPEGDWIALRVEGDSMDRISPPGSIILVNRRDKTLVANACYVIADGETGQATYKRYRPKPMRFEPVSVNPNHQPIYPDNEPKIVGRVRRSIIEM